MQNQQELLRKERSGSVWNRPDAFWKEVCESVKKYCFSLKSDRLASQAVQRGILGARRLLKNLGDGEVPVNVLECALFLEAKIVYDDSLVSRYGVEGLTIDLMEFIESEEIVRRFVSGENGCKYLVVVDGNLSDVRKRFVIAHELGHIYLRHVDARERMKIRLELLRQKIEETGNFQEYYEAKRKTSKILKMQEVAANAFAGELLVPSAALRHYVCCEKLKDPFILAEVFLTSYYVVLIQLCYLNLFDTITLNHGSNYFQPKIE